jgi:hypothetical protein
VEFNAPGVEFDARSIYPIGYTALADRITAGGAAIRAQQFSTSIYALELTHRCNAPAPAVV